MDQSIPVIQNHVERIPVLLAESKFTYPTFNSINLEMLIDHYKPRLLIADKPSYATFHGKFNLGR